MIIRSFQPITFPNGVDVICPTCDTRVSSSSTIMLLLVTASYKIAGTVADEEMVCCGDKIRAPKFFSDYDEASAFVNRVIDGPNWHTLRILPTVPDILEMLEGVDMPISILEDAIRESDVKRMAMNWELLRQ